MRAAPAKVITTRSITSGANAGYPRLIASSRPERSGVEEPLFRKSRHPEGKEVPRLRSGRRKKEQGPMSEIDRLRDLIDGAKRIVAFTGAGISTESGIPDFRSPGGIWTKYQPIYFDDFMASEEMRRESWRRKFATDNTML